jgi:hypothetical protein
LSTLAHSAVHVSVCSSMAIDGAAFDRPTVAPTVIPGAARHEARRTKAIYRKEHWQPIAVSGAITTADSIAEVEAAITRHLADPTLGAQERQALLATMLTTDDGRASERTAAELADLLRRPAALRRGAPGRPATWSGRCGAGHVAPETRRRAPRRAPFARARRRSGGADPPDQLSAGVGRSMTSAPGPSACSATTLASHSLSSICSPSDE